VTSFLDETSDALLSLILPIRPHSPSKNNDYAALSRLEEIEDKIATADEQLNRTAPNFFERSAESAIDLHRTMRLLRPNEAIVVHAYAGYEGLVTTCINSESWTFYVQALDASGLQRLAIDSKLLLAAVHGTHEPSSVLDAGFPSESAHHLFKVYFGGIEACLNGKTHILLATDPDLFALPWNALLTTEAPEGAEFRHRDAAWLPKTFAISLLPSVRSIHQLRSVLPTPMLRGVFWESGTRTSAGLPVTQPNLRLLPYFPLVAPLIGWQLQTFQGYPIQPMS